MKIAIWSLLLALPMASQAQAKDWQAELEAFRAKESTRYTGTLWVRQAGFITAAGITCGASVAVTAAAFIADTAPVVNGLAEVIGTTVEPQYQTNTYNTIASWEAAGQFGRGLAGGAVIGVAESLEFVTLWLAGNEDQSFKALSKMYASSFATAGAMFSHQSQCMMNLSKILIIRSELNKRYGWNQNSTPAAPSSPIVLP